MSTRMPSARPKKAAATTAAAPNAKVIDCAAARPAEARSREPTKRATTAVVPTPRPRNMPMPMKVGCRLRPTEAIAERPSLPTIAMSAIRVCNDISAITGHASRMVAERMLALDGSPRSSPGAGRGPHAAAGAIVRSLISGTTAWSPTRRRPLPVAHEPSKSIPPRTDFRCAGALFLFFRPAGRRVPGVPCRIFHAVGGESLAAFDEPQSPRRATGEVRASSGAASRRGGRVVHAACPLNCWDGCALKLTVSSGRIVDVEGDPDHETTRGFACRKARYLVERMYSSDRVTRPLRRTALGWTPIGWEEALDLVAEGMERARARWGPASVLHYTGYGSLGELSRLEERFFNLFGGATRPVGSLCNGAGLEAQRRDFGANLSHDPFDALNSRTIIVWGRNPAATNIHLMPILLDARERGADVVVVDPVRTATARWAGNHVAPRPGTDEALALAMANVILSEGLQDDDFISQNASNFASYEAAARGFTPEAAERACGVPAEDVRGLALAYARNGPAAILIGYGMQRYSGGGAAVRAVDALAAITGNLGIAGGGASYSSQFCSSALADLSASSAARAGREIPVAFFASELLKARDPRVEVVYITRANPAAQVQDAGLLAKALRSVPLVVVCDFAMTDTARLADVVLPCAAPFEKDDVYVCSWHNYVTYARAAVPPSGEALPEAEILYGLARRLGFGGEMEGDSATWAERLLEPLRAAGLGPDSLAGRSVPHPFAPDVPWEDGEFMTPSGRFELYAPRPQVPGAASGTADRTPAGSDRYPLVLLTPKHPATIHSMFYDEVNPGPEAEVRIGLVEAGRLRSCCARRRGSCARGSGSTRTCPRERSSCSRAGGPATGRVRTWSCRRQRPTSAGRPRTTTAGARSRSGECDLTSASGGAAVDGQRVRGARASRHQPGSAV